MPVSAGKCLSNSVNASNPPADAPMPTMGKVFVPPRLPGERSAACFAGAGPGPFAFLEVVIGRQQHTRRRHCQSVGIRPQANRFIHRGRYHAPRGGSLITVKVTTALEFPHLYAPRCERSRTTFQPCTPQTALPSALHLSAPVRSRPCCPCECGRRLATRTIGIDDRWNFTVGIERQVSNL